jgi:hypothetical protein
MNMNLITRYKKTAVLATFVAALSISSVISAGCGACAAAAAIRQSIKDAQAAALGGGKKSLEDELDEIDMDEADVDAEGVAERAPREELVDPCNPVPCTSCEGPCSINCKLQTLFNCCVDTNKQVRRQGQDARRCCKRLNHKIEDLEDQVSVVDSLLVSQGDTAAACCSVTSAQIAALSVSVADVFALLTQVFNCTCL